MALWNDNLMIDAHLKRLMEQFENALMYDAGILDRKEIESRPLKKWEKWLMEKVFRYPKLSVKVGPQEHEDEDYGWYDTNIISFEFWWKEWSFHPPQLQSHLRVPEGGWVESAIGWDGL
jgi:hypothetical protein